MAPVKLLQHLPLFTAHAFGVRYELPLPLWLYVLGGAGIVLVTAAFILPKPVERTSAGAPDTSALPKLRWAPFILSYGLFFALVSAGMLGSQEVAENILPTLFWLVLWIAIPLSCGLVGNWTGPWNVFATVSLMLDNPKLRRLLILRDRVLPWPAWLGWWPAVALYFLVASGELIFSPIATTPHIIAGYLTVYFVASGLMGLLFGPAWLQQGELFNVLFSTWGRLGYFRFGSPGRRGFASGLTANFEPSVSRITFVLLLLSSVAFDGLLSTPLWNNFDVSLSATNITNSELHAVFVAAFILVVAFFWLAFGLFALAVKLAGRLAKSTLQVLGALLPSLIPISFGYLFAHNVEYLVINSQLLFPLIGNPTGLESWPIQLSYPFNDSFEPSIHLLPGAFYWYLAVVVIVAVHIIALIIAHRDMGSITPAKHAVKQAEFPWVGAMVLYTMLSLWLLAQPLVKEQSDQSGYVPAPPPITQDLPS
jgi:hypothetical protein